MLHQVPTPTPTPTPKPTPTPTPAPIATPTTEQNGLSSVAVSGITAGAVIVIEALVYVFYKKLIA